VLDLAEEKGIITGLVGHLKPGRPEFGRDLARFIQYPLFRGIRTGLWGVSFAPEGNEFVSDLRFLAERGLALDVLVKPDQLTAVAQLAAQLPELPIVIDHCANVGIDGRKPPDLWLDGIRAVARFTNVHMKVSGLVEGSGMRDGRAPADVEFYRPVLDAVWDAFGEDRVIYGSNWPVSTRFADYATVLGIVTEYFVAKGGSVQRKYFRENARRVYKLVKR
jgi:L-fuconolactonase